MYKKIVDKLVEECSENIDGNEMIYGILNDYGKVCNSYTIYIALFDIVFFLLIIGIGSAFIYFHWYLKKNNTIIANINSNNATVIITHINGKYYFFNYFFKINYYFFNGMINIKNFDSSLLKTDKKSSKNIDIYCIGYITIKSIIDYINIHSLNPLQLIVGEQMDTLKENGNKYLTFASTDKNKEVLTKYT